MGIEIQRNPETGPSPLSSVINHYLLIQPPVISFITAESKYIRGNMAGQEGRTQLQTDFQAVISTVGSDIKQTPPL